MKPFTEYLNAVNTALKQRYGVTTDDTGLAMVIAGHADGMTPAACADAIADKYELIEIQQGGT